MTETDGATPNEATEAAENDDAQALAMQVDAEKVSDIERKLDVEIPWDEVKSRLDEAYGELRKGVSIKGFRKGKVPRKMLRQLFGKHVVKEVAQRLIQESIPRALEKSEISPVSEPQVEEQGITEGEAFRYTASMQVLPEVVAKDYEGVDVKVVKPRISDEAVEMALMQKQREHTDYRLVEGRETRQGDVLLVDVMGKVGDRPLDLERKMVELADPPVEPLPGLAAELTGIAPETEELDVELEVPQPGSEGAPEPARLLVTIHEINEKIVPALDDDFAQDTGEAETLDELKTQLRKKVEQEAEQEARDQAKQTMMDTILERNEVPVVPALVDRHLDRRLQLQKVLMGIDPSQVAGLDEQAIKEEMRAEATSSVQKALLLKSIGEQEKVEVTDADVEKKLSEIAAQRGQNMARVRSEYEKDGLLQSLRDRIQEDKTLDLLMSKANIIMEESSDEAEADGNLEEAAPAAASGPTEAGAAPAQGTREAAGAADEPAPRE